jgi:16S rRNA (adenine1518-N6/adenine1519-N6)-dimethyltransferase
VGPGDRVLEIGAGLGSLTLALVQAGGEVLAVELDRSLLPALREVVSGTTGVRIERADAMTVDWGRLLEDHRWKMVSNLPYNVGVPVVVRLLEEAPRVDPLLVMVQREVGERLAAGPGEDAFGAVSLRVAYRCRATVVRRIPPSVFWPQPNVESVLALLERRQPPVEVAESDLFRLIDEGFAQRRKTMANALVRLGLDRSAATSAMERAGLNPRARAEDLGLEEFARLAGSL